jgi:uncharacterized membrane protein YfcA
MKRKLKIIFMLFFYLISMALVSASQQDDKIDEPRRSRSLPRSPKIDENKSPDEASPTMFSTVVGAVGGVVVGAVGAVLYVPYIIGNSIGSLLGIGTSRENSQPNNLNTNIPETKYDPERDMLYRGKNLDDLAQKRSLESAQK